MRESFWQDKKVLITGHTGFKGSWLALWLSNEGAKVHGIALPPTTHPNFFTLANIHSLLVSNLFIDICNFNLLKEAIDKIQPEIVFHLAAQPLIKYGYDFPLQTYAVNVMGTVNVLECIRLNHYVRAAVIVTTDKCYENQENTHPYHEKDRLGGTDPYSNSKACAELICSAYRQSFFSASKRIHLATARAGNVIGGGDWAENRLIPDCIRALTSATTIKLRSPHAIRPWQHVLEPIYGYILLAERLFQENGDAFASSWNFGPSVSDIHSVSDVTKIVGNLLNITVENVLITTSEYHESAVLLLDSTKARKELNWIPQWRIEQTIQETIDWYQHYISGNDMLNFSLNQINHYKKTHD